MYNFVDDDKLDYSLPLKRYRYEPSNPHTFKLQVISSQSLTTVVKMNGKRAKNIEGTRGYIKVPTNRSFGKTDFLLNWGKFMSLMNYSMREFVGRERNF